MGGTIDIGAFEVQVGPVASFVLFPFMASVPAGSPVDLYVAALDASGHLVTDYAGTVYLVSTDPALVPVAYSFLPEDAGVAHLTDAVTFRTPGPQLLLAIDATCTAIGLGLYEVVWGGGRAGRVARRSARRGGGTSGCRSGGRCRRS